jgi:hypothetical protein
MRLSRVWVVVIAACSSSSPEMPDAPVAEADAVAVDAPPTDLGYTPPIDPSAITGLVDSTWQWVPIANDICRDGSPTGIIVNPKAGSTDLVVFVQGGGSCYNAETCGGTPSEYGSADAAAFMGGSGILDRVAGNPVANWNYVFVPYCTGDVHAGNNPNAMVSGVADAQQFVGYVDMELVLARLAPTFPTVNRVLLTGTSAGGSGAYFNYLQTRRAFPSTVKLALLDDSGPPMPNTTVKPCFQQFLTATFRFDRTLLGDCGAGCSDPTNYFLDFAQTAAATNPTMPFGFLDAYDDMAISSLYGQGWQSCDFTTKQPPLSNANFEAGQNDERTALAALPNVGSFLYQSNQHTVLMNHDWLTNPAGLAAWTTSLVGGHASNVGP